MNNGAGDSSYGKHHRKKSFHYRISRPHVEAGGVRVAGLHQASPISERHNLALAGGALALAKVLALAVAHTVAPLPTDCIKHVRPMNVMGWLRRRTPARPRDRPAPISAPPASPMRSR